MKTLVLYSKPGCHLCEGLQEKLAELPVQLEVRDITTNDVWFQQYQYEVPVLLHDDKLIPRISPRASVSKVAQIIQTHVGLFEA